MFGFKKPEFLNKVKRKEDISEQGEGQALSTAPRHSADESFAEDPLYPLVRALNEPLTLLLGSVESLTQSTLSADGQKHLQQLHRQTRQLLSVAQTIGSLAQTVPAGDGRLLSTNITELVTAVAVAFEPVAGQLGIKLVVSEMATVQVKAVHDNLEVLLCELLTNALQFSLPGTQVTLNVLADDGWVQLMVSDEGPGIRQQDQERVLQAFTCLQSGRSAGQGVGLTVAKAIAERHQGQLEVDSEWGKGATFLVRLPCCTEPGRQQVNQDLINDLADQLKLNAGMAPVMTPKASRADLPLALLIDDQPAMADLVGRVLSGICRVRYAADGESGLSQSLEEPPDLVICEVMLADMSGHQVCRVLRQDERTAHIPIIQLSAMDTPEVRRQSWQLFIDHYLAKPFSGSDLQLRVQAVLNVRQILSQHASAAAPSVDEHSSSRNKAEQRFVQQFTQMIAEQYPQPGLLRADLARKMAMSESQLQRKLKAITGQGAMDLLREHRLLQAAEKLKQGLPVGVVSDACGFNHVSYFSSCFRQRFGLTPKRYQQLH
jgi:CheY-like chemotaxis protein